MAARTELSKAYRASSHEEKAEFSREIREKLYGGVTDAIDALIFEAKNSKNSQARVAAARQVIRMAYVAGVLERDALKDFLNEIGAEFEKLEIG